MRRWVALSLLALCLGIAGGCAPPPAASISKIAFGSCANQGLPQPIWDAVNATRPDIFVFLGDNIYADTTDPAVMRAKYAQFAAQPGLRLLRRQSRVVATWDDHDYGRNDAGADYPMKQESRRQFLNFWQEPWWSTRRSQEGGVYTAYSFGPAGERVNLILLDTRWNRSPLARLADAEYERVRVDGTGPYTATVDAGATLLGDAQWRWLEAELRTPAELHVIATSIPFLQEGTGWEIWANFPRERARLLRLIDETGVSGVLFITGDTHRAQFSHLAQGALYPLWEINSSGLTENAGQVAPDSSRVGGFYTEDNFGLITIDWTQPDPLLRLEIRSSENRPVLQHVLRLSELSAPP